MGAVSFCGLVCIAGCIAWRPRGLSKWVISRVISTLNGVILIITLLITDLVSPPGLQVGLSMDRGSGVWGIIVAP